MNAFASIWVPVITLFILVAGTAAGALKYLGQREKGERHAERVQRAAWAGYGYSAAIEDVSAQSLLNPDARRYYEGRLTNLKDQIMSGIIGGGTG